MMAILVSGVSSSMECRQSWGSLGCLRFVSAILFNHECYGKPWLLNCQKQNGQNDVGLVSHSPLQYNLGKNLRSTLDNSFPKQFIFDFMTHIFSVQKLLRIIANFNR